MKAVIALTLLLAAASSVSAQHRREVAPKALIGAAEHLVEIPLTLYEARPSAAVVDGRRLMSSKPRRLLGDDNAPSTSDTQSRLVSVMKQCPDTVAAYETIYVNSTTEDGNAGRLGELVVDHGICTISAGKGGVTVNGGAERTYGGSAQDFVNKPSWETYGWSLFYVPVPPEDDTTAGNITRIQGMTLQVVGNLGTGTSGTCTLEALSVAIFEAGASPTYTPGTMKYQRKILMTGAGVRSGGTFEWTSNSTAYVYTDIVDIDTPEDAIELVPGAYYWLRVKMFVPYLPTKKCFAYWGMSSTVHNAAGVKSRWQERGGSAGYSTNCVGADTSPTATPGQYQTFWNCWNNGVKTNLANPLYRRCSTYRLQVNPSLAAADCTGGGAQFNDYNYNLVGMNGEVAVGGGGR